MPNFPYVPFRSRRIKGFDLLARYLWPTPDKSVTGMDATRNIKASDPNPPNLNSVPTWTTASAPSTAVVIPPPAEFLLFLGDFIYADVPLYFGDDKEAYRRLYRRNYLSNSFRKIYERLRRYHFVT
jgi:alkaline phosphatase D